MKRFRPFRFLLGAALLGPLQGLHAQADGPPARVQVDPSQITLDVGGSARLKAVAYDASGRAVTTPIGWFSTSRRSVEVDSTGAVKAHAAGQFKIVAVAVGASARAEVTVTVRWPAIKGVSILDGPHKMYVGTTVRHQAIVKDAAGLERHDSPVKWSSDNEGVLSVDRFGDVTPLRAGVGQLLASSGGMSTSRRITIVANPARTVILTASMDSARTGDVVHFTAVAKDAAGNTIADMPITFSVKAAVEDTVIASEASALIEQDGRFVAQRAGDFTVIATAGHLAARKSVAIGHRYVSLRLEDAKGEGRVKDVHTSDIWVWSGKDGRDYALTGTWGAGGATYFWDVTDPANPVMTDSLVVDARTTNDVKVDEERGICIITREGASNRKNGFIVVDCSDPRHVKILSSYDDGLWGGVHNTFVWNKHVFAINAGRRFDIISIEDPSHPKRVGFFELDTPGHGIHDVWVVNGIAYASQWQDGVILVDVGNGIAGGSLSHPVQISSYKYPIGATHSAFPYRNKTNGKFYVFVGDEQFPYGSKDRGVEEAGGYIHIVDFTDIKNPKEVGRYQIPEAGPHNFWIENDTMYVAYYNAGLRVVDVSGELMGNLYDQGRELARFKAFDPNGFVPNAPMAWGPQPHKGHIFFSDHNSGLWAVKLPERPRPTVP